jgi:phosphoribosylformylglycinamidine cyclo-ligase
MARVFNLGLGMVAVVPAEEAYRAIDLLRTRGHNAVEVGHVVAGEGQVHLVAGDRV